MEPELVSSKKPGSPMLWAVLGIVVVIVAAGMWYVLVQNANTNENTNVAVVNTNRSANRNVNTANTNTTIDMSGWKTYTNSGFGFSLQYPSNWSIVQESSEVMSFGPTAKTYFFEGNRENPILLQLLQQSTDDYIGQIPVGRISSFIVGDIHGYQDSGYNGKNLGYILPSRNNSETVIIASMIDELASANSLTDQEVIDLKAVLNQVVNNYSLE